MKEILNKLVNSFNTKAEKNDKLKKNIGGLERSIQIEFTDDGTYYLYLKNIHLSDVIEGTMEKPDIKVQISSEDFNMILNKQLDALSAYVTKKLVVKASLSDKLLLTDLLK
jgi:putative sterol carrier protein